MIKLLQSKWVAGGAGLVLYLLTTVLFWNPQPAAEREIRQGKPESPGPSWTFQNPELNHLISELQRRREALAEKETQLNELSARLEAERQELNQITQSIHSLQVEFDRNVVRVQEQEVGNLKKLGKMYAGMAPENAVLILKHLDESTLVKIFAAMRDSESGMILEVMGKGGEADSKLAATLSERLRLAVPAAAKPEPGKR